MLLLSAIHAPGQRPAHDVANQQRKACHQCVLQPQRVDQRRLDEDECGADGHEKHHERRERHRFRALVVGFWSGLVQTSNENPNSNVETTSPMAARKVMNAMVTQLSRLGVCSPSSDRYLRFRRSQQGPRPRIWKAVDPNMVKNTSSFLICAFVNDDFS